MKKKNAVVKPKVTDYFKPEEVGPIPDDMEGHVMILDPVLLAPQFRKREFLLQKAFGGFGCKRYLMGRAVMCECVGDKEHARWDKYDFVGEYIPQTTVNQ